jgi:hypothetical protein
MEKEIETARVPKMPISRVSVQCDGCGYEWKVNSLAGDLYAEVCIVCGCLTVHTKNSTRDARR